MFVLVDSNENLVLEPNQEGLLLYYGKTVCDDLFTSNSADAICREMGYPGATSWRIYDTTIYDTQSNVPVGLDNVVCVSDNWDLCLYITDHNCDHTEDVFLTCGGIYF